MAVCRNVRFSVRSALAVTLGLAVAVSAATPIGAEGGNNLQRVRGTIGYEAPPGTFHAVFGRAELADSALAVTRAASAAVVALPDSSLVSLGENTSVTVGALVTAADGAGSTIAINNGALRFDVRRPAGGRSNYRFTTTTSQIAVRGTVGLISFVGGNTTVVCLACQADSVTVSVGNQTFSLLTGQTLTVTAAGAVTSSATASSVLQSFTTANVPVSSEATSAAAGVPASAAAASSGISTAAIVAGGAIGAAAIATVVSSNGTPAPANPVTNPSPTPQPTASPTPTPTPTPTPAPTATPTGQTGNVTLNGHARAAAAPAAAPASVVPVPTMPVVPAPGRGGPPR